MATPNFFRIMLGLPTIQLTTEAGALDIGVVSCNNGAPNGGNAVADSDDQAKVYTWKALSSGIGTGVVSANFEAETHISRFQIIWNNDVVADSLFIGDDLGSQPNTEITKLQRALEYGFKEMNYDQSDGSFYATSRTLYPQVNPYPTSVKCLWEGDQDGSDDRILYNVAMTGSGTPQSINRNSGSPLAQVPNSPSQGYYENNQGTLPLPASGCGSGSYVAEGTTANYPASSSASWNGQINLQFTKSLAEPSEIFFRVWSVDDAQWSANSVQCPGGGAAGPVNFDRLNDLTKCWNHGGMSGQGAGGGFPFTGWSYGVNEFYHLNSIYPSSELAVTNQLYENDQLSSTPALENKFGYIGWTALGANFPSRFMQSFPEYQDQAFPAVPAYSAYNIFNGGGHSVAGQQVGFNGNYYIQGDANGKITAITGSFIQWLPFQVKFVTVTLDIYATPCQFTSSYTPDTTYYFSDGYNQGLPNDFRGGGHVLTGDPGQPDYTVTGTKPFGVYTQGSLDSLVPKPGWYTCKITSQAASDCSNEGVPNVTMMYIGTGGRVIQSPMAPQEFRRGPCYPDNFTP